MLALYVGQAVLLALICVLGWRIGILDQRLRELTATVDGILERRT